VAILGYFRNIDTQMVIVNQSLDTEIRRSFSWEFFFIISNYSNLLRTKQDRKIKNSCLMNLVQNTKIYLHNKYTEI